jgi:hypothetical protein
MFVGHYGLAFAAKRVAPRTSLGTLFLAAQLVDLIWPILLLMGVERVRIAQSDNPFLRLAFEWYPWTHSLVTGLLWGALFGTLYAFRRGDRRGAVVTGALVVSHWVLDLVTHVPDLPIYPGGPLAGFGLWRSFGGTMIVEALILAAGVVVYSGRTKPADRSGRYGFFALVAFLGLIYAANAVSPPPPDATAVAWASLAAWIFPVFGWWVDRHRTPTPT